MAKESTKPAPPAASEDAATIAALQKHVAELSERLDKATAIPASNADKDALISELREQLSRERAPKSAPNIAAPCACDLADYKHGEFRKLNGGAMFKLKIIEEVDSHAGRTHLLKNDIHYIEVTAEDFRLQFEKP